MKRPNYTFLDHDGPIAFVHRGGNAAGAEKENTMPAFQSAYDLGYRYFETDVVLAASGEVVAFHGSATKKIQERTGLPLRGEVEECTYNEIRKNKKFWIGGEPMPLLADVLTDFPDVRVNIDAKTKSVAEPLGRTLLKLGAVDRVCVASFYGINAMRTARVIEEAGKKVCTSAGIVGVAELFAKGRAHLPVGFLLKSKDVGCLQVPLTLNDAKMRSEIDDDRYLVNERVMEVAYDAGLPVHVWTVNDRKSMLYAMHAGVDGIMTDETELLLDTWANF